MHNKIGIKSRLAKLRYLKQTFQLVWHSARNWSIANLVLLTIQGILPLLILFLTKQIIDTVSAGITNSDKIEIIQSVMFLIGIAAGVYLIQAVIQSLSRLVEEHQILLITDHVHNLIHAKSAEMDLEYYENPHYFDTLHRAQQESIYRPTRILGELIRFIQNGIGMTVMLGLLVSFHWIVVLVLFLVILPGILVRIIYSEKMYTWEQQKTANERRGRYYDWMLTGDIHAKELRIFNLAPLFINRFQRIQKQLRFEKLKIAKSRVSGEFLARFVTILAIFGVYSLIAFRTIEGMITIGGLIMYFQAFQRAQNHFREILGSLVGLYENSLFASFLFEFLNLKPKIKEPEHPKSVPKPMKQGIVFHQVSFQYPTGTRPVLHHIDLEIKPGETVALVGNNGSGKTTLIKLLCRLYDPTEGFITLDGIDIREIGLEDLRKEIGVIFQDFTQYQLTARENIWLGNINLGQKHETRIIHAAKRSGAHELIKQLPKSYETMLGKWFSEGEELSVGEWQKIALARAFLRESQITILDEPTSALDAKTEYHVFKKFHELVHSQSTILISHRFSTVRMADTIYVVEDGKIIEKGSHQDLMQKSTTYATMFEMQAQCYR